MSKDTPKETPSVAQPGEANRVENSNTGGHPLDDISLRDYKELLGKLFPKESKSDATIDPSGSIIFNIEVDIDFNIDQGESEDGRGEATGTPNRAGDGARGLRPGGSAGSLGDDPLTPRNPAAPRALGDEPATPRTPSTPHRDVQPYRRPHVIPIPNAPLIPIPNPPSLPNGYRGVRPGDGGYNRSR